MVARESPVRGFCPTLKREVQRNNPYYISRGPYKRLVDAWHHELGKVDAEGIFASDFAIVDELRLGSCRALPLQLQDAVVDRRQVSEGELFPLVPPMRCLPTVMEGIVALSRRCRVEAGVLALRISRIDLAIPSERSE